MKMIQNHNTFFDKFSNTIQLSFSTIQGLIVMIIGVITALSGIQKAILALIIMVIIDFITGCVASWVEYKNSNEKIKVYFFESKKMRLSLVKCITYCLIIFCCWLICMIFFNKSISIHSNMKELTPVEIVIGVCIGIEIFSNIENLKRAGFDIIGKLTILVKKVYSIKNLIKTGKDDE